MSVLQVLQLYQITQLHHGLMMVGPSGSGKSTAWRVLLKALERIEGVEGVAHIIDPKVGGARVELRRTLGLLHKCGRTSKCGSYGTYKAL